MGSLLVVPLDFSLPGDRRMADGIADRGRGGQLRRFSQFSQQPITHATYLTLLMGCIAAAAATAMRPTVPRAVMVGVLCGTLYLTRPKGL